MDAIVIIKNWALQRGVLLSDEECILVFLLYSQYEQTITLDLSLPKTASTNYIAFKKAFTELLEKKNHERNN